MQKAAVHPHVKKNIATQVLKLRDYRVLSLTLPSFLLPSLAISTQEGLIRHMLTCKTLECGVKFKSTETSYFVFFLCV